MLLFIIEVDDMENKKESKIEFEPFPGSVKTKRNMRNLKKIFLIILLFFLLVFLYVSSSILNKIVLYGNASEEYKTINKFNSNYASIPNDDREEVLKNIGFTSVMSRKKQLNDKVYDSNYAYKKTKGYNNKIDEIAVVYDNNDSVKYIELILVYSKYDFSISRVAADSNAILKNYVKMATPKKAIAEAKNNGYYYYNDLKTKTKASYILTSVDKKYYSLKVIINV